MGAKESKAFTEHGIKNIYLSILIAIPFCILTFLTVLVSITAFVATLAVGIFLVLIFFIKGMGDMLSGREELGEKHASNVIFATVLSSAAIIVFLFLIILVLISGSILISSFASSVEDSLAAFVLSLILILALSISFLVLIGLGLIFFVKEVIPAEKKSFLWISFGLLIAFPFLSIVVISFGLLFCIAAAIVLILPLVLFVICYKVSYLRMRVSGVKAVPLVPCPFCDKVIPTNSTSCRHCGAKFEEDEIEELDPRLNMDTPEPQHAAPHGYTPVKGPSESQKRRLFSIISLVIVLIVVAAALFLIFSKSDTERFIGTWRMDMPEEMSTAFGEDVGAFSWVLCENGSMKFSLLDNDGYEIASSRLWGEWGVKDNKLYTFDPSTQEGPLYDTEGVSYEFSNDDKRFEIEFDVGTAIYSVAFNKVD